MKPSGGGSRSRASSRSSPPSTPSARSPARSPTRPSAWSVARAGACPCAELAGLAVGLLTRPPRSAAPRSRANPAAEQYVERLEALGARVVEAEIPEPPGEPGRSSTGRRREAHRAPSRAAPPSTGERPDEARGRPGGDARRGCAAREAVARWRTCRPPVDLYVSPSIATALPPEDCDELEVRVSSSRRSSAFNVLGWAAIAIGDLQLARPRTSACSRRPRPGARLELVRRDVLNVRRRRAAGVTGEPKPEYVAVTTIRPLGPVR